MRLIVVFIAGVRLTIHFVQQEHRVSFAVEVGRTRQVSAGQAIVVGVPTTVSTGVGFGWLLFLCFSNLK